MKIIPVIDYMQGHVVFAQMGKRDEYKPVSTPLCSSSSIYDVLNSLLSLACFNTIYIADLDCIQNQQLKSNLWNKVCAQYPHIEFWIDLGTLYEKWPNYMKDSANARPVIGSESFTSNNKLMSAIELVTNFDPLLSLDFNNNAVLGPLDINISCYSFLKDVIVLSIDKVGSNYGPDIDVINYASAYLQGQNIYYGGGIRNIDDIETLNQIGVSGVLSASLLHKKILTQRQLNNFTS